METCMTAYDVAKMMKLSRPAASRMMVMAGAVDVGTGTKNKSLRITETALMAYLETKRAEPPVRMPIYKPPNQRKLKKGEVLYPGLQGR